MSTQSLGDAEETSTRGFKSGRQGKEPRKLVIRFVLILATTPVIGWMIGRAWVPGNQFYDGIRNVITQGLGLPFTTSLQLISMFGIGAYLSLLTIFTVDMKKRVQGVLLLTGTVIALVVTTFMGVLIAKIDLLSPLNIAAGVAGFVLGLGVEYRRLLNLDTNASTIQRPTLENGEVPEFRLTALLLLLVLTITVIVTLAQVVLADVMHPLDFVASGVFLILLFQFIRYSSESSYMILGPARSGKSMLMLGLCLRLMQKSESFPNPNEELQRNLEQASNLHPGRERWPIESTPQDELTPVSFEVISGYYFPRRLKLSALDYAGQYLGRITELIESDEVNPDSNAISHQVANRVINADTILVLLDMERLYYPEKFEADAGADSKQLSWGLNNYTRILNNCAPGDIVVVATKCDIMIANNDVNPPRNFDSYSEFQQKVTETLSARPDVQGLLNQINESEILPVFYRTEQKGSKFVPKLDDQGNLIPVGFGSLIDELRRRQ